MAEFIYNFDEQKTLQAFNVFEVLRTILDDLEINNKVNEEHLTFICEHEEPLESFETMISVYLPASCVFWRSYVKINTPIPLDDHLKLLRAINRINGCITLGSFLISDKLGQLELTYCWPYGPILIDQENLSRITGVMFQTMKRFAPRLVKMVSDN